MTAAITSQVAEVPPSALVPLAVEYTRAETEVKTLEGKLKEAKVCLEAAEKKLVDEMVTQQLKSFKAEGLGGFRAQAMVYPNVVDKEALGRYVKKYKLDWLFTTAVNGSKLRAWVRELLEQGTMIPPGIDPYTTMESRRF